MILFRILVDFNQWKLILFFFSCIKKKSEVKLEDEWLVKIKCEKSFG